MKKRYDYITVLSLEGMCSNIDDGFDAVDESIDIMQNVIDTGLIEAVNNELSEVEKAVLEMRLNGFAKATIRKALKMPNNRLNKIFNHLKAVAKKHLQVHDNPTYQALTVTMLLMATHKPTIQEIDEVCEEVGIKNYNRSIIHARL